MKILLIAIGTRGDVQPFVVLGKALAKHGHHVSIAAASGFKKMIAAANLEHHPLPVDFQELLQQPEMRDALNGIKGKLKAYRWTTDLMNQQFDTLWQVGLDHRPDLILHHFKSGIAPQIARKIGAQSVPVMLQPGFTPTHDYPQFLIASRSLGRIGNMLSHHLIQWVMRMGTNMMVRRWQKHSGTDIGAPMDQLGGYNPNGAPIRIHAYSNAIIPRPDEWSETEIQTGYLFAEPETFEPPADLAAFLENGPPPIYIGFGSMPGMDEENLALIVNEALSRSGHRAVVATGWGALRKLDSSDKVHVIEGAPHSWLFPRMAAVVHHGGSGTTHEGLRWGRPSIVCPLFADQPFFGQRVADLGAGPKPIRQKKLTPEKLISAFDFALKDQTAINANKIAKQMRAHNGVSRICALVDTLATN